MNPWVVKLAIAALSSKTVRNKIKQVAENAVESDQAKQIIEKAKVGVEKLPSGVKETIANVSDKTKQIVVKHGVDEKIKTICKAGADTIASGGGKKSMLFKTVVGLVKSRNSRDS